MPAADILNSAPLRLATLPVVNNEIDFSSLSNVRVSTIESIRNIYFVDLDTAYRFTVTGLNKAFAQRLNDTGSASTLKSFATQIRSTYNVNTYMDKLLADLGVPTLDIKVELALTLDDNKIPSNLLVTNVFVYGTEELAYARLVPEYVEVAYY